MSVGIVGASASTILLMSTGLYYVSRRLMKTLIVSMWGVRMTDRLYDRLPLEVAEVLLQVERWHDHAIHDRAACAESDLTVLADLAALLVEWKARQSKGARVQLDNVKPIVHHDSDTHYRMFAERPRFTDKTRPKLHIVPVEPPSKD